MFPIAISCFPFLAADMLTASSGRLVPSATIVAAIIVGAMFMMVAISITESIVYFAPKNMNTPLTSSIIISFIGFFVFSTSPFISFFILSLSFFFCDSTVYSKYIVSAIIANIPSIGLKVPSIAVIVKKNALAISIGKSTDISECVVCSFFESIAATPMIKNMFVMFDPITVPATISLLFCITAIMLDTSSGRLVPIATIVTPIMNFGIFRYSPIVSAESVK